MPSLIFSHVFFSFSSTPLLEDISFSCEATGRLCLVGPNGAGKTTILRLARGELTPERGTVTVPEATPAAEPTQPSIVGDILDAATAEQLGLQQRFDELTARLAEGDDSPATAAEYDAVLARMTALDVWSLSATTETILAGLGLTGLDRTTELATLSPGQRGRLELAALILSRPSPLVLDEPTNHLDDEAREFLAATLLQWEGPVLFASHDRSFIDQVATAVVDLDTAAWDAVARSEGQPSTNGVHLTKGNYSDYLRAKREAQATHELLHERQQAEKAKLTAHRKESEVVGHKNFTLRSESKITKKFYADRAQAVSTRRKTEDDQRLERLANREVRKPRYEQVDFALPAVAGTTGALAVDARSAAVRGRLSSISFSVSGGEHLLVTGPNGSGKSTLLNWIHRQAPPADGASGTVDTHLTPVLLPQNLPAAGDALMTEHAWEDGIGETGKGYLAPRFWATPVSELSDGNQRRAQLALAMALHPELLIVDEPTNYLDLEAVDSLERALHEWNGTLLVATHDRWLIDHWGEQPRIHLSAPE